MPETFKFTLADVKIKPKTRSHPWPWQIAVLVLLVTTLGFGYLYLESRVSQPITLYPALESGQECDAVAITYTANAFLYNYLTYAATQLDDHQKTLVAWMTPEYADAYKVVWQDRALSEAVKERKVEIFVTTKAPLIIGANEQGRTFVDVSGKITVKSDITYIQSQEKIISGTLTLVKTDQGLRVSNVVWKNNE